MITNDLFSCIGKVLSGSDEGVLLIKKQNDSYLFERVSTFDKASIQCFTQDTARHLKDIIGTDRLKRIFIKTEIDSSLFESNLFVLTKDKVHRLFIGLMDIDHADLTEKIAKTSQAITTKELDLLHDSFFDLSIVRSLFHRHCKHVSYHDDAKSSGKGFIGLQERVSISFQTRDLYRNQRSKGAEADFYEIEMLASRFIDREPPIGSVIRLQKGYFLVDQTFAQGGAYIAALRPLDGNSHAIFVCRGTAARLNATSGILSAINDCLIEIGVYGIEEVWPSVKAYCEENNILRADVLGKSLGGGQAQKLAVLLHGKTETIVDSLSTFCSVGVSKQVQYIFNGIHKSPPKINIYRNSGHPNEIDYIPLVGGPHLHTEKTTIVYYVNPSSETHPLPIPPSFLNFLPKFLNSFQHGHQRQNTLRDFSLFRVFNVEREANKGAAFETIRISAARLFNLFSFGVFNKIPFNQFYTNA